MSVFAEEYDGRLVRKVDPKTGKTTTVATGFSQWTLSSLRAMFISVFLPNGKRFSLFLIVIKGIPIL